MKEEPFNLWHASARNVIEQIFGVLKRRFWILLITPEYSLEIQAHIPAALATVHNFICHHEPGEDEIINNEEPIGGMVENVMTVQSGLMEGWVNKMQGGTVLPVWCGSSTKWNMLTGGFLFPVECREEHEYLGASSPWWKLDMCMNVFTLILKHTVPFLSFINKIDYYPVSTYMSVDSWGPHYLFNM